MTPPSLQIVRRFSADPLRVYAACSDPSLLSRWFGPKDWTVTACEADVRVGGVFRFTMVGPPGQMSAEGTYETVEAPHRLVHTWRWSEGPPEYPPEERISRVTYLIEADEGGTRLTFTHEGLQDQASADSHNEGWSETLDKLDLLLREDSVMSDADHLRGMVRSWAKAVETADRAGVLAHHADDVLMFDFPDTVRGIDAYARTWDFFDTSRRGSLTFAPGDIAVSAGDEVGLATCKVHCDDTTAGPIDFRLTVGFEKRARAWAVIHEHHSMPVTNEAMIGPEVHREETRS